MTAFAGLARQCWLFAVGSTLFAVATVPGFPGWAGAGAADALCFAGSWFFTAAAWMQLSLSDRSVRDEYRSAAVQFAGTVLFNVSTGAAVWAHAVTAERRYVWTPDAAGSLAFLISGVLAVLAARVAPGRMRGAAAVNLAGCLAFGVSAAAAFVRATGVTEDELVANLGTFLGALCFLAAALMLLPRRGADSGPAPA